MDGVILNTRVLNSGVQASNDTLYLHTDNLGSVEAYSDRLGAFVNRMSFSDWGKRQQSDWKTGSPTGSFPTANGYTGHHQLDQHKLVHMGGRVYDPSLGRFMSADLFVQSPYSSQSFNRYSYVSNNPMSRVDPTGYLDVPDEIVVNGFNCPICDQVNSAMNNAYSSMYSNSLGSGSLGNMGSGATTIEPPTPQQQLDTLAKEAGGTQNEDGSWDITDKKGNVERYRIGDKNGKGLGFKITDTQRALAAAGDRKGFWKSRWEDSGDPMGKIGLKAVKNEGGFLDYLFGGQAINHRLQAFARVYGDGDLDLNAVGIKLMNAHINAVDKDDRGALGLLSPGQIATYHHSVFAEYKLPPTTFGGTPFTGSVGEANWTASLPFIGWCGGCDTQ